MPRPDHLYNGVETCRHNHEHYSTPWTIYVVDPEVAKDVNKYGDGLYPIDSFDTKEEAENLYKLPAFSEPNGPPSWSMVVEGGAIAVFQGGEFGFPSVTPKWEDPAARNGNEFRFAFSRGVDPFKHIDQMFMSLTTWIASHPVYENSFILGLFIKNVRSENRGGTIQARLWVSEIPDEGFERIVMTIGNDFAEVLEDCEVMGTISFKPLDNLIKRSGGPVELPLVEERVRNRQRGFRITVPRNQPLNGGGKMADKTFAGKNGISEPEPASSRRV